MSLLIFEDLLCLTGAVKSFSGVLCLIGAVRSFSDLRRHIGQSKSPSTVYVPHTTHMSVRISCTVSILSPPVLTKIVISLNKVKCNRLNFSWFHNASALRPTTDVLIKRKCENFIVNCTYRLSVI